MNFDKQYKKKATHNFPPDRNTKSKDGTNDPCSQSVRCSKKDAPVKERSNTEDTFKPEKRSDVKENSEKDINKDSAISIYTCPRVFHDLRKIFECKNKTTSSHEKPDMPCTCENCALMGIVKDSQKIPLADEVPISTSKERRDQGRRGTEEPVRDSDKKRRYKTNFKEDHTHCHHYRQLLHRIKELEERLNIQEETTVPKVEFKKIITGLLTYLTVLKNHGKTSIATQCSYVKEVRQSFEKAFSSQPPLNTEERPESSRNYKRGFCDKKTSPIITHNHFWKWGEEILKPGIDIKNKIILLVEDTLKKFPKDINEPDDHSDTFIADTSNKVTLNAGAVLDTKSPIPVEGNVHCSDTSLRISYINPVRWEQSDSSLERPASDMNLSKISYSLKDTYREKFNRMVRRSSHENRQRLWDTVWRHCLIYGYGNGHIATIYYPQRNGEDRITVEFTVEELKNLLTGKKS